ncbi:MAG: GNAT family N-acetyltransferase [Acidimicrobiales bacterium]
MAGDPSDGERPLVSRRHGYHRLAMSEAARLEWGSCDPRVEPASGLIGAMVAEMRELYDIEGHVGVPLELEEMAPPGGVYLVGRMGVEVVAGGGLRTIGERLGEIKRMYVVPSSRGAGVGAVLLGGLEGAARDLGMTRVRLDTGTRQAVARRLYERSGYASIGNYNSNVHAAFWGEKLLA